MKSRTICESCNENTQTYEYKGMWVCTNCFPIENILDYNVKIKEQLEKEIEQKDYRIGDLVCDKVKLEKKNKRLKGKLDDCINLNKTLESQIEARKRLYSLKLGDGE